MCLPGFATAFEANVNWRVRTASGVDVIPENCTRGNWRPGMGSLLGCTSTSSLWTQVEPMNGIYLIDMKDRAEYSRERAVGPIMPLTSGCM